MTDRFGPAVCAIAFVATVGCGKIEKLEQPLRPSVDVFAAQTQPVFERQGCSRSQCHGKVPEGVGGLKLTSSDKVVAEDADVLANYAAATAFIDLGKPADSVLIRAPFLGAGGEVDHPEYYGRFSTATDCCYCSVLLWICEESTPEACEACRKTAAPDCECDPASFCEIDDEGEVTPAADTNLTWIQSIGPLLQQETTCGGAGCHGLKGGPVCPILFDQTNILRKDNPCDAEDEDTWLTPCKPGGGTFVQYALGVGQGADEIHAGLLEPAAAASVAQWVIDLGAPLGVAAPPPNPNPDPDPDPVGDPRPDGEPDVGPGNDCDPESPTMGSVTFAEVKDLLSEGECIGCHAERGSASPKLDTHTKLLEEGAIVPCEPGSKLLAQLIKGPDSEQNRRHEGMGWERDSSPVDTIRTWIEVLGAPL